MKNMIGQRFVMIFIMFFFFTCSLIRASIIEDSVIYDKIKGGWVGQMAGVSWGSSTEFRYLGSLIPESQLPVWTSDMISNGFFQDDLYVEIPFIEAMKSEAVNCPISVFADYFKNTRFQLWHANLEGRNNLRNEIPAPNSGNYKYNLHCDDIDWQIESNFAGLISPAMVNNAIEIAWRGGHVMNYGDGVYGGVFVAAMHASAFTATSLYEIIETGIQSIPEGSKYRQVLNDVINWKNMGNTWQQTWQLLQNKWGNDDRCPDGLNNVFNIDAKLNGAYVLIGLLYGEGDFENSIRIAMRCGQDSDCNPSTVGGIMGTFLGYSDIPEKWKIGLDANGPLFSNTNYNLNQLMEINLDLARQSVIISGGHINGSTWVIPEETEIIPPIFEQWPENPNSVPELKISVNQTDSYTFNFDASATDQDGTIKSYQWYFGDLSYSSGAQAIHTYLKEGKYEAVCYVTDNVGNTAWKKYQILIGIQIIQPGENSWLNAPADIPLEAEVSGTDVDHIEFYSGNQKLAEDLEPPYRQTWNNVPIGVYQIYAKAILTGGSTFISDTITVSVFDPPAVGSVWNSWNVETDPDIKNIYCLDETDNFVASVEFYESTDAGRITKGQDFSLFTSDLHEESFNNVNQFWANNSGTEAYPYAGKSSVGRGQDVGESNAIPPLNVYDLQLHPPDNDNLTVAAFRVPANGSYELSNLGVRRVSFEGNTILYKVFNSDGELINSLKTYNDQKWVYSSQSISFDSLKIGDLIYFAVDRDGDYGWDATEISWTIRYKFSEIVDSIEMIPDNFILYQNFPNPYNLVTTIGYSISKSSLVTLKLYDIQGRAVATLVDEIKPAGNYNFKLSAKNLSSGIYFYQIKADNFIQVKKMILLK